MFWLLWFLTYRVGNALNPGTPDGQRLPLRTRTLELINPSLVEGMLPNLLCRPANAALSIRSLLLKFRPWAVRALLSKRQWTCEFSCLDPELSKTTGGVAAWAREPGKAVLIKPISPQFKEAFKTGRMGFFGIELGFYTSLVIVAIYGWSGGRQDTAKGRRTDSLIKISSRELAMQPQGPKAIAGDMNADSSRLLTMQSLTREEGWLDYGANASRWAGTDCHPTCCAPNSDMWTRNDLFFGTPLLTPFVKCFNVVRVPAIKVHLVVSITFHSLLLPPKVTVNLVPPSMFDTLWGQFIEQQANTPEFDENTQPIGQGKEWETHLQPFRALVESKFKDKDGSFVQAIGERNTDVFWKIVVQNGRRGLL